MQATHPQTEARFVLYVTVPHPTPRTIAVARYRDLGAAMRFVERNATRADRRAFDLECQPDNDAAAWGRTAGGWLWVSADTQRAA